MMNLLVGNKLIILAAVALAVGSTLFFTIQYIRSAERDKVTIEIQERQIEKRKKVDEAVNDSPTTVDDSLQQLNNRK